MCQYTPGFLNTKQFLSGKIKVFYVPTFTSFVFLNLHRMIKSARNIIRTIPKFRN